jgi:anti-anti-sigma regulatory factor
MTIHVNPDLLVQELRQEALEALTRAGGELVLDFSTVVKIDAAMATAMEELADRGARSSVLVGLRGVNVGIYRALKLLNVANKFSFLS